MVVKEENERNAGMPEQANAGAAVPVKAKANPAPLGLLGFGMTTVLLNIRNSGITGLSVTILAMGFALGGLAQMIAGILEYRAGNTFGGTAFTAYGCFWWSLVVIWWNPFAAAAADGVSMGFYLLVWGIFTAVMAIGTLKHNVITRIVFFSLAILFFGLALGDFTGAEIITKISGAVGILCGLSAIYSASAQILNAEFKKKILPV